MLKTDWGSLDRADSVLGGMERKERRLLSSGQVKKCETERFSSGQ